MAVGQGQQNPFFPGAYTRNIRISLHTFGWYVIEGLQQLMVSGRIFGYIRHSSDPFFDEGDESEGVRNNVVRSPLPALLPPWQSRPLHPEPQTMQKAPDLFSEFYRGPCSMIFSEESNTIVNVIFKISGMKLRGQKE